MVTPDRLVEPGPGAADGDDAPAGGRADAGLDMVDLQVVRRENTGLPAQMIADLETRLAEPAAG
ncbi:hypothetical protein [Streptosporangium sp. NPDC003464]